MSIIINHREVKSLLPMGECIDVMECALKSLAEGTSGMSMRSIMGLPSGNGLLAMMPSHSSDLNVMGVKVVSVFPGNFGTQYDSHQGIVLLYDGDFGRLLAIVDAGVVTAIRTAAISALATKILARENAETLTLMGSGTQAKMHLDAMLLIRPIKRIHLWSYPLEHARKFAVRESRHCDLEITVFDSPVESVRAADIICTATTAREPFLMGGSIPEGVHINAIGACTASTRELDTEAVARSKLYVDLREAAMKEAGDFIIPLNEGVIGDDHVQGDIADLLTGRVKGRESESDITLFKAVGLAIEDLAAAYYIYEKAKKQNVGSVLNISGDRHESDQHDNT